jgi:hypothetical protein
VSEIGAGAEHHRARAGDHLDVVLTAVVDRLGRHARCLRGELMHPDAAHARGAAVAHDPLRDLGSRDDHGAIDAARDRLHVRITGRPLEALHVRIHREDIVTGLRQPVKDKVPDRVVAVVARHADDRDALLREEVVDLRL